MKGGVQINKNNQINYQNKNKNNQINYQIKK